MKLSDNMNASSFAPKQKLYIDPAKLLPLQRFLPQPPKPKIGKKKGDKSGGAPGGDRGGRGGGRGGFGELKLDELAVLETLFDLFFIQDEVEAAAGAVALEAEEEVDVGVEDSEVR